MCLFEFKLIDDVPDGSALAQIRERGYADRHRAAEGQSTSSEWNSAAACARSSRGILPKHEPVLYGYTKCERALI